MLFTFGVGIYKKHSLKLVRINPTQLPNLPKELVFQGTHAVVKEHVRQKRHENDLGVSLATIARFGGILFLGCAALYNHNAGHL
jgi:hypothetical protein